MQILNDICEVITCGVAKRPEYVEEGIPFLSSKNVKENRFILKHYNYVSEEDFRELTKHNKPENGDILYTRVGSYGEAAIVDLDFEFAIFVSLTLIKPKPELVYNRYLMHYLNSPKIRFLAENSTSGIGVKNLNVGAVREFPIDLPPLKTQQKIVAILDEADRLRQLDKQLIQKYEDLSQSLFLEMFGDPVSNPKNWKKMKVSKLIQKVNKIKKESGFEEIDYIDISSIDNKAYRIVSTTKYDYEDKPSRAQQMVQKGDILMSTVRPNLKNIGMVEDDNLIASSGFFVFRANDQIENEFLFEMLKTDAMTNLFIENTSGANYPAIKNSDLSNMEFIVPDKHKQKEYAKKIGSLREQLNQATISRIKTELLFNSLLQKAFKGELV